MKKLPLKLAVYNRYFLCLLRLHFSRGVNRLVLAFARGPVLVRINAPKIGLFAHVNWCVELASWGHAHQRPLRFICTSANYGDPDGGRDWLPTVLEQRGSGIKGSPGRFGTVLLRDLKEFPHHSDPSLNLSIDRARAVFDSQFSVPAAVESAADEVTIGWPAGRPVVGVHFRGTDKLSEARPVSAGEAIAALLEVNRQAEMHGLEKPYFFIATDDQKFLEGAVLALGPESTCSRSSIERSTDNRAVHLSGTNSAHKAFDAMVDAVVLSRCPILVRTASFLSGWAAVLARRQTVIMLNEPYGRTTWFPDGEIRRTAYKAGEIGAALGFIATSAIA